MEAGIVLSGVRLKEPAWGGSKGREQLCLSAMRMEFSWKGQGSSMKRRQEASHAGISLDSLDSGARGRQIDL